MSRLLKAVVISFFCFFLIAPPTAFSAQQEFVKAVQEGNNLQWLIGSSQGMMANTTYTIMTAIAGARDESNNLIQAGAIQQTTLLMANLYQKPASSAQYIAYLINRSKITKSVYAQGSGWEFLTNTYLYGKPEARSDRTQIPVILKIWEICRNITYLIFIVIFVAIGFMIMFRSKLNPQTTVSIQLALPNIIFSLILVTFSFAICGLIIDTVFLGHKLIEAVFFPTNDSILAKNLIPGGETYSSLISKIDIISALLLPNAPNNQLVVASPWRGLTVFSNLASLLNISNIFKFLEKLLEAQNFFSDLIPLILLFTLLGTAIKIFFALITKYVALILSTIFSPFVFLLSAFPGKNDGIGSFIKTMLSAALTFPATAFMFYLSGYFIQRDVYLELGGLPPLNKFGVLDPNIVQGVSEGRVLEPLIALGILMATTQVPQAIDQALGAKPGIAGAAAPDVGSALSKIPIIGSLL